MAKQQAVAPVEVKNTLPVAVADLERDAGGGFEEADRDSYAIPALAIIQKGSPQVDQDHAKYKPVEGAAVGHLINTVTEEVFDGAKGVLVLPCHYQHSYTVWKPRNEGGGFAASLSVAEGAAELKNCTRNEKNQDILPNGNQLVDTRTHYVLVLREDGTYFPAVLRMSSTQIKKSKKWMSNMNDVKVKREDGSQFTPPMWAKTYRLATVAESNAEGNWRGWAITREGDCPSPELYAAARAFRDAVRAGDVKLADEQPGTAGDNDDVAF